MSELRVAVDARLVPGGSGGVESMVIGLVSALSALTDGDETYQVLVRADAKSWISSYIGGKASLLPTSAAVPGWRRMAKRAAGPFATHLGAAWRRRPMLPGGGVPGPPPSDGTIERAGVDVVHFTLQKGFRTDVPSIYHPHDLQHMYLPEFFTARERAMRDRWYRDLALQATLVAVTSTWVRNDVVRMLGIPEERVQVVPWAPILHAYPTPSAEQVEAVGRRYALPNQFVFYPAQTWPHKNHVALLEAVAILRRHERLHVPLVFSGRETVHAPIIRRRAEGLGISDLVHWTGFVSPLELQALYRLAHAVVIPTRFEAASGPLWEAFLAGVPAACSNVTSLPAQAGDAAILFDPDDLEGIASAIHRLWMDDDLRHRLVRRGRANVKRFRWDRTARLFRAHYRRIAGRQLNSDDAALLAAPPLL